MSEGEAGRSRKMAGDAGRLISFGLRPRLRPSRDSEYQKLVLQFHADPEFEALVREVATGQGLSVLSVDRLEGIVLVAVDEDSPYRMRLTDYVNVSGSEMRLLHGLVQIAIAATAYPTAAALEDDQRLASVSAGQVFERIRRIVEEEGKNPRTDPPEDMPELEPVWRLVGRLRAADTTADGRETAYNVMGAIRKALRWLGEHGLADEVEGEKDTWRLRERYRLQVLGAAADVVEAIQPVGEEAT